MNCVKIRQLKVWHACHFPAIAKQAERDDNWSSRKVQGVPPRNRQDAHFYSGRGRHAAREVRKRSGRSRLRRTLLQARKLQPYRLFQGQRHGSCGGEGARRGRRHHRLRFDRQHLRISGGIRRALRSDDCHRRPQQIRRARQARTGDYLRRANHAHRRWLRRRVTYRARTRRETPRRARQFGQSVQAGGTENRSVRNH